MKIVSELASAHGCPAGEAAAFRPGSDPSLWHDMDHGHPSHSRNPSDSYNFSYLTSLILELSRGLELI